MVLRIHLTGDDLARITLPPDPRTIGEAVLSLQVLRQNDQPLRFGVWRDHIRRHLTPAIAPLAPLVPATGWLPDFLTPSRAGFSDELEAMSATPHSRVTADLARLESRLDPRRRLPSWTRTLTHGDPDSFAALHEAIRQYYGLAVAPYIRRIDGLIHAERTRLIKVLAEEGAHAMLRSLHHTARWNGSVLEIPSDLDEDFHLHGRELAIRPRFFCGPHARALVNDTDIPTVIYPVPYNPLVPDPLALPSEETDDPPPQLTALLGRTRATLLAAVAEHPGHFTGQLASRVNISLASASEHITVLRDAGLVVSQRNGQSVVHFATTLGEELLGTAR